MVSLKYDRVMRGESIKVVHGVTLYCSASRQGDLQGGGGGVVFYAQACWLDVVITERPR